MLGDSIRRRLKVERSDHKKTRAKRERPPSDGPNPRWRSWVLTTLVIVPVAFGIGYGVAVRILFPAPAAASGNAIEVPVLTGGSVPAAEDQLEELGLVLGEVDEIAHPEASVGTVIAQTPLPGQQLRPGAEVRLAMSAGPMTTAVPDLIGLPYETARSILQELGFEVNRSYEVTRGTPGVVLRTHPGPGGLEVIPTAVTLTVSVNPEPEPEPEVLDSIRFPLFRGSIRDTLDST